MDARIRIVYAMVRCTYVCMYVRTYVCGYGYVYVFMCVRIHLCACVCIDWVDVCV